MSKEPNSDTKSVNIQIHRIYSKNQRVVIQGVPEDWNGAWNPKIDLRANPRVQEMDKERTEIVLALQINAQQENKPVFEIYFEQAGIFTITAENAQQRGMVSYGACSNFLFPYAGVMINQILTQSSLQPVYLAPLDFIQLYRQHQQQQQHQAEQEKAQSAVAIQ
ncbi:MAG: protein-export chaperone SecB [Proteobacteria bacterium]|nr:protein-export chaperone SecB [Pseudomonadota bacterium]